jgi:TRAP-type C4-dicarboxylate transport system substrate-binding protein
MKSSTLVFCAFLAAFGSISELSAETTILRMASNVPAGSPWDIGLRRLAAEFDQVSGGRVKVVFPQSAHVATESDIIQKMRFGIDGALLTTYGLAELYPDSLALSLPNLIRNDAEFDAVLGAVAPLIKSKLEDRYVLLGISRGGWLRYFSRSPILYPSDLVKLRISLMGDDGNIIALMQSAGARTIIGTTSDFLLQFNSNAADATISSPIYIASLWSQLRGKISYMSPFKVAPFVGALLINKSAWEKIPAELRPAIEKAVADMAKRTSIDSAKLETEAIAALDGIKVSAEPADAAKKWADQSEEWRKGPVERMFSPDILGTIDKALVKVRSGE